VVRGEVKRLYIDVIVVNCGWLYIYIYGTMHEKSLMWLNFGE